jgi:hypothetical protein
MITTANLGLTVWDSEEDDFEHSQLADNFVRIDAHSHAGGLSEALNAHDELEGAGHWTNLGLGLAIRTAAIEPAAILRYLIKERAVGHKQIDIQGVESENIADENVLNVHVADEAIDDRTIKQETITIDKLDPNILTLGSVILWYKYSVGATPGDLWHICDGTAWASIPNDMGLSTGNIPDLRERFARGSDLNHTGAIGGASSVDLAHAHDLSAASLEHTHTIGSHNHTIVTGGKHHHTFEGGYQLGSRRNAFVNHLTLEGHAPTAGQHVAELQSVYLQEFNEGGEAESAPMDQGGEHNHGGSTGLSPAFGSGGSSLSGSIATDTKLAGVEVLPPYVGLCYLMLVRNSGT